MFGFFIVFVLLYFLRQAGSGGFQDSLKLVVLLSDGLQLCTTYLIYIYGIGAHILPTELYFWLKFFVFKEDLLSNSDLKKKKSKHWLLPS